MLYKNEFGADFDLGFNLSDYPYLKDKSWHNDVSPSFYFNIGSQYYVLWVDHSEPDQREGTNCRYLIQYAINEGTKEQPEIYGADCSIIFESNKYQELANMLRKLL